MRTVSAADAGRGRRPRLDPTRWLRARRARIDSYPKNLERQARPCRCLTTPKGKAMTQLNRRTALASIASLPTLTVPAVAPASSPDPVYMAIERHRRA
jgi:hypothetical protein